MGIKKLTKNKYRARYFAGYNSRGKRIYPSKTFCTRADANTWLTAKLREKHLGDYLPDAATETLSQYIDTWLAIKKPNLRENTLYVYKGYIEQYIRPELGRLKLPAIRSGHIETWQSKLLEKISARTVAGVRVMLGGIFRHAVRHRRISHNPVREAEPPKWKRHEKQAFTREQANQFMLACKESRLGTCLTFMLNTGLRPEEIMALRWKDLSLDGSRGACHVRKVILRIPGGGWRFEDPKSASSVRVVGFSLWLIYELKEHRRQVLEDKMRAGRYYNDHDLVFPSVIGTPQTRGTLTAEFKETLKRAGLQTMRLYDLRHSFVTIGLAAGVDPKTVSEEAGHATVAFTLDHYGHVLQSMREGAVDKREAWLRAQNG
jgi:integrase